MGSLDSRIKKLEQTTKHQLLANTKSDTTFRNYIVTRNEFDHLAWNYHALCQQPEINEGIRKQFGEETYNDCARKRNEMIQGLGELANKPIMWFLEMFLEHILEYPHKIDFDLKDIGNHARREIEEKKRSAQFYPEGRKPIIPKESDYILEHYNPIVRKCEHIEYYFND